MNLANAVFNHCVGCDFQENEEHVEVQGVERTLYFKPHWKKIQNTHFCTLPLGCMLPSSYSLLETYNTDEWSSTKFFLQHRAFMLVKLFYSWSLWSCIGSSSAFWSSACRRDHFSLGRDEMCNCLATRSVCRAVWENTSYGFLSIQKMKMFFFPLLPSYTPYIKIKKKGSKILITNTKCIYLSQSETAFSLQHLAEKTFGT